jgi:predicted phage terminase large subunit-like protein
MRELIKSEWYQSLWSIELAADLDGKQEFGNTQKGIRQARSFTSLTGVRADRVMLDDPISADNANSDAHLRAALTTFKETLPTRINNSDSAIVVIMQRLNQRDTSGVILGECKEWADQSLDYVSEYEHLCLPMRFEPLRACATSIGWCDWRTKEGELMFPERFDESQVKSLEQAMGTYAAAGQLQQRPAPRGGGLIQISWFRYWYVLPEAEYRWITADTALKAGQQNDYSVIQYWMRSTCGGLYLVDQIRGKWESPELLQQTRSFWLQCIGDNRSNFAQVPCMGLHIEDKASGTGLIQQLRREGIPVVAVQRSIDKITRTHSAAPSVESGVVHLPHNAPWLKDLTDEIANIPAGAHDDQWDAMMDAIELGIKLPASKPIQQIRPQSLTRRTAWSR